MDHSHVSHVDEKRPLEDSDSALAQTQPKRQRLKDAVHVPESNDIMQNELYTVGWICAIHTEYVAAQAFLDDKHGRPEYVSPRDNNDYTLGTVGKHNVVIAVLPDGEYGTASAAGVARDMVHSFPNVRIGLMVGIGGGAPSSKHDIRLGDIVVSAPRNGKGAVSQYDFGKTIQDQSFLTTSVLDQPPTMLRTAVSGLRAKYETEGNQIQECVDRVLEYKTRLQRNYRRPDQNSDRLYLSSVVHPAGNEDDCTEACDIGPSALVVRNKRADDEDNSAIHYGLVASANQLMKDALVRDKLAEESDVLCFEMEAAGLMNHFPCLVIRGICDYSDTHKNKLWQGYAAMAAAAYAKDLLCRIPPNKIEAEHRIGDVLSSLNENFKNLSQNVNDVKLTQREEQMSSWLSAPDPSTNLNKASEQRHKDTGVWFLKSNIFQKWQTDQRTFIWLHGIPGCGKTILSSAIIEHLENTYPDRLLLYFYFDFTDSGKQTLENVVRSLVIQLYRKCKNTQTLLDSLFSSHENGRRQLSCDSLCKVFLQMVDLAKEVYVVLDALDECQTRKGSHFEGLLSWIESLRQSDQSNLRLLVTSRPEHDIETVLRKVANGEEDIVPIQSKLINDDIRSYVHTRVRQGDGLKRWNSRRDVLEEIETQVMDKANGMFRWAVCQLDVLEECLDYPLLKKALASLPKTLDETYSRIMAAIPADYKAHAIRILQFLTFSERPLSIGEAVDAIAVDLDAEPYFDRNNRMPDPQEISRYCSSLVVVVSTTSENMLQLAHFSVKEYLTSDRLVSHIAPSFQMTTASALIAKVSLAFLLQFKKILALGHIVVRFPFAEYAAKSWMSFATISKDEDQELLDLIEQFFCFQRGPYIVCYALYRPDRPQMGYEDILKEPSPASPLYYAALGGLLKTVRVLLEKGADVNAQDGYYGNALQAASAEGHEQVVKFLLDNSADVNAQDGKYGNALQAASSNGHEQVVKRLLDNGADVNAQGVEYGNALYAASGKGYEQVVKLLLGKDADVNAQDGYYGNALQAASFEGHEPVVKLLLDKGADVNAQGGYYGNALQAASVAGHKQVVKFLLDNSADANAQDGKYGNALQAASSNGHEQVVKLLLDNSADVIAQGGKYGNALQAASYEGHEPVVKLLLDKGADVNAQGGYYGNALQAASAAGHKQVLKLLLDNSADVNTQGGMYGNALQAALSNGHEQVAKLLLDDVADVNAQGGEYGNALYAASDKGYEQVVKLLLDKDADVNAQGGYYGNALQAASFRGHEPVVKLLLKKNVNVNVQGGEYGNALQSAVERSHEQVVRLLLDQGADVNTQSTHFGNALYAASYAGHEEITRLLLNKDSNVNAQGGKFENALQAASRRGYEGLVRLLLGKGANVNLQSKKFGNALQVASAIGNKAVVRLLVNSGADLNAKGGQFGNALQAASWGGHEAVVKLLRDHGAATYPVALHSHLRNEDQWKQALAERPVAINEDNKQSAAFNIIQSEDREFNIRGDRDQPKVNPITSRDDHTVHQLSGAMGRLVRFESIKDTSNTRREFIFRNRFDIYIISNGDRFTSADIVHVDHFHRMKLMVENYGDLPLFMAMYDLTSSGQIINLFSSSCTMVPPPKRFSQCSKRSFGLEMVVPTENGLWACKDFIMVFVTLQPSHWDSMILRRLGEAVTGVSLSGEDRQRVATLPEDLQDWASFTFQICVLL